MRRKDLEKWLEERGLIGTTPSLLHPFRSSMFNESNLDVLYGRLAELQDPNIVIAKL